MALTSINCILAQATLVNSEHCPEFSSPAALTRPSVFCTLLSNNAPGAFSHFLNMRIKPFLKEIAELWAPA